MRQRRFRRIRISARPPPGCAVAATIWLCLAAAFHLFTLFFLTTAILAVALAASAFVASRSLRLRDAAVRGFRTVDLEQAFLVSFAKDQRRFEPTIDNHWNSRRGDQKYHVIKREELDSDAQANLPRLVEENAAATA